MLAPQLHAHEREVGEARRTVFFTLHTAEGSVVRLTLFLWPSASKYVERENHFAVFGPVASDSYRFTWPLTRSFYSNEDAFDRRQ